MFIADSGLYKKLSKKRSSTFAKVLSTLIPVGAKVLDFGCGNMYTAAQLLELRPDLTITGLDVVRDQNLTDEVLTDKRISFKVATKNSIEFEDETFDSVVALATMHHTTSPEFFLSELKRVTKKDGFVIIIEEMYHNVFDKIYISAQDWILNKMKKGIPVPLNFRSNSFYLKEFEKQGLKIESQSSAKPFPTFMHHYVFKLSKV
jgi:ubiquinone/menaquinone biosynthesis C-methylase UbiE